MLTTVPNQKIATSDNWRTPLDLFATLDREFTFSWDLAAQNAEVALCESFIPPEIDSLTIPWHRLEPPGALFCNPPFSQIAEFARKAMVETYKHRWPIVLLAPGHRHEQAWFHDFVLDQATEIRIPRGRVAYCDPEGEARKSPRFPSVVIVYQPGSVGATRIVPL